MTFKLLPYGSNPRTSMQVQLPCKSTNTEFTSMEASTYYVGIYVYIDRARYVDVDVNPVLWELPWG